MNKKPVNLDWFRRLDEVWGASSRKWLSQLSSSVESIANFGCWSSEPFVLMWTLDATEVKVIEKEEENLSKPFGPKEQFEYLKRNLPSALEGRSIEFITKDMSKRVDELRPNYFDLAYCERVLCYSLPDLQKVQSSINEMTRVVKPGAWVIAVNEPEIDFRPLFTRVGLIEERLKGAPEKAYCYRKPLYS
jgi:hypothetical protein